MKTLLDIKNDLTMAMAASTDEVLAGYGFRRFPRSTIYKRGTEDGAQHLEYCVSVRPSYEPNAESHINVHVILCMRQVADVALSLVEGDLSLLGKYKINDRIANLSLEWLAPKHSFSYWFAIQPEDYLSICSNIKDMIVCWGIPFLDAAKTPADLIRLYELQDPIIKRCISKVYLAAAYRIIGEESKARDVVTKSFDTPHCRKRYSALFRSLGMQ